MDPLFREVFAVIRDYPKVLKMIAYGGGDVLFEEELLNEKFIHFSLVNGIEGG